MRRTPPMTRPRPASPGHALAFALLALLSAVPLVAQEPAGGTPDLATAPLETLVPLDPAVLHDTLPNGLVYYVRENREPRERVELRLVIRAGSVLEDEDQRGLAHLVEHMAFNGTENFEKQALVDYLESIGMRFGPDVNAYTSFDETVYMLTVPTDSAALMETGLDILAEWSRRVAFDPEEVARERPVVVEEWRLRRGAGQRTFDKHMPVLFHGSRYAERLPIGRREIIENAPVEALRAFYDTWYRPDLAAVVAVGDFDAEAVVAEIRERFADWRAAGGAPPRPAYPVPPHAETLVSVATDPEATLPSVSVYHKRPPRERGTLSDYRRSIVERLRDQMLNQRYFELIQVPDPPFVRGFSGGGRYVETVEVYVLGAGLKEDAIARGIAALVTEAERVDRHGFTETELEREKRELLRAMESRYDEREKTSSAAHAARLSAHFLEGAPVPGAEADLALHRRFAPTIDRTEVERAARESIAEESRVILVTAPEKEGVTVPAEAEVRAAFEAAQAADVAAYEDAVVEGPLVEAPPESGRIVAEREIAEIGVTVWELSNGAEMRLKPTDFKDDEVLFQASSFGGSSLAPDSLIVPAGTSTDVVQQSGAGTFDQVTLGKALAGKQVFVFPYVTDLEEGFFGRASPKDLETLFQLVWLQATAPRRDPDAFASLKTRMAASLANRAASPEAAWQDTLSATLAGYHPRLVLPTPAMVEAMDLDASLAFYRDRFADFDDWTFFLVGAFEPDSVRPLVERWIATLPPSDREESWRDTGIDPPEGAIEKVVRKGIEPKSLTEIVFTGPFEWSLENVNALNFLTDYLEIRLREEMREDLGGTYFVSVSGAGLRWPDERVRLSVTFGSDPGRADELASVAFREIGKVRAGEVDAEDFAKVSETTRRELQTLLRQNRFWAGRLEFYLQNDLDPREILRIEERIAAVGPSTIADAARRWIDPARYVRVSLVPAEGPGGDAPATDAVEGGE